MDNKKIIECAMRNGLHCNDNLTAKHHRKIINQICNEIEKCDCISELVELLILIQDWNNNIVISNCLMNKIEKLGSGYYGRKKHISR